MAKAAFFVSWDDVPHLGPEAKAQMLSSIPPWQRDSRSKGVPQLGSGSIYTVAESDFTIPDREIPSYWPRCYALDVGWNRTAALWGAHDRETGIVYIYDELYKAKTEASIIAASIRARGAWVLGVVDPAARGRSQKDGTALLDSYCDLGLDLEPAINAVEAGLSTVWERLSTSQIKVFRSCTNFFAEYRLYRRDEKGKIVKSNDHLMDALRYLIMSGLDRATVEPNVKNSEHSWQNWRPSDVWAG